MYKRFVNEKSFSHNGENINDPKNNFGKVIKIMKRTFLFSILLLVLAVQVSYAGDNTFPPSGNVGIGTASPGYKLTVNPTGTAGVVNDVAMFSFQDAGGTLGDGVGIYISPNTKINSILHKVGNVGLAFHTYWYSEGLEERVRILGNGNVGIGTTEPNAKLAIGTSKNPEAGVTTAIFSGGVEVVHSSIPLIDFKVTGGKLWRLQNDSGKLTFRENAVSDRLTIDVGGNVGIGTTNPQSKLAVDGTITAKEVVVTVDGWADFVFENDYTLTPLNEVEHQIKENKHLPDIPSADEVAANGVSVGEMQAKLLQKVEELTLYMIELKKENDQLKARVSSLENANN